MYLGINKFQSLFYWILFFYRSGVFQYLLQLLSFNPYSTGFSSFILKHPHDPEADVGFQSLFYWILFFYNIGCLHESSGNSAVSILILLDSLLLLQLGGKMLKNKDFVSILILLDSLLLLICLSIFTVKTPEVSILILLDSLLLFYNLKPFILNGKGFQSLFYWILFFYPFYRADSLFLTLIEFF